MSLAKKLLIVTALAVEWLFYGCASYQAGDGTMVPFSSIQISPVINESQAPQINQVVNHDLREVFIKSGKVQVESTGTEAKLNVTLSGYERQTIATNSQDTALARKYALTLTASCDLINLTEESPYFLNREVSVTLDIFLDSGQTSTETNAIPLLSKKLAEAIENEVLQVW
ncbi:MAG: LPS assembly lipoprotein LptE [Verrucomicrobia bacterium]|nr:LPS assembly lipoprotein LptE [Verrucomicrobiota bacterium]MDA1068135.1 LPS assembly lipoprotein LptE [Verrucomicrobiota bacterium]